MQISSVLSGFSDAALGRRGETPEAADIDKTEAAGRIAASFAGRTQALGNILSQYDVGDISPSQFSEMVQKLFDSGVLSEAEFQQLAGVRQDLDAAGVAVDQPIHLLDFYSEKIEELQREAELDEGTPPAAEQLASALRRLQWIQKFATIQSDPDSIGLDALV